MNQREVRSDTTPQGVSYSANSEADTQRLAAALAAVVPNRMTVGLIGTLGAGKTRLIQDVAESCGVPREDVGSPTFVLCREYHGTRTLFHMDVYRLRDEDEFLELGPEEYFRAEGTTWVEWADRVACCLPPDRVEIQIVIEGPTSRRFEIRALGVRSAEVVRSLAGTISSHESSPELARSLE